MRFYADENFPLAVVNELRRMSHDVLTAFEDGRANQGIPDRDVLTRAVELERAVLTINRRDFKRLHQSQNVHPGIIICTFDPDFQGQAQRIDAACRRVNDMSKQLISVYRNI